MQLGLSWGGKRCFMTKIMSSYNIPCQLPTFCCIHICLANRADWFSVLACGVLFLTDHNEFHSFFFFLNKTHFPIKLHMASQHISMKAKLLFLGGGVRILEPCPNIFQRDTTLAYRTPQDSMWETLKRRWNCFCISVLHFSAHFLCLFRHRVYRSICVPSWELNFRSGIGQLFL